MKKWDKFIISSLFLAALLMFIGFWFFGEKGTTVSISQDDQTVFEGSLFIEKTVELDGNTVEIKNSTVIMKNADCENQICVNHSKISKKGESIICLPNKVIIEIK